MRILLMSLILSLTLLLSPIAHAVDTRYDGNASHMSGQITKTSQGDTQQDNDTTAHMGHHCCCPYASPVQTYDLADPRPASSQALYPPAESLMSSVVQGPPLKPPSIS